MARPARRIDISPEDDLLLRELETSPHTHPKLRLRASILRLHRQGWSIPQLSYGFRLIPTQGPPVEKGVSGEEVSLSFQPSALFAEFCLKVIQAFETLVC